jgi:hypothetical protein
MTVIICTAIILACMIVGLGLIYAGLKPDVEWQEPAPITMTMNDDVKGLV